MTGPTLIAPAAQTTVQAAVAAPATSVEIEAARQTLERIYQGGAASGLGTGTSSAGSRALGVLIKGLGLAVSTFSIWNALAKPAGMPALQEATAVNGVEGFFDQLTRQTAEAGGDQQAVSALRDTVMGFLEQGRVHSAGVVLGETFELLQEGGLFSDGVQAFDFGMSTALRYAQDNPSILQNNLLPTATPATRPDTTVAPLAPATPQAPALTAELNSFREDVKNGHYANSDAGFETGQTTLDNLVDLSNEYIEAGQSTINQNDINVAQTELNFRRLDSILSQFDRNAISGGALPDSDAFAALMTDVRALDTHLEGTHGVEGWNDASLDVIDNRVSSVIDLRTRFDQFATSAESGEFANSASAYSDGSAQLEAFRLESNSLQSNQDVAGIGQDAYDSAVVQLEGRRQNSMIAQGMRDLAAGRNVDLDVLGEQIGRLEAVNARSDALFGQPVISGVEVYREALQNAIELEPIADPLELAGGNDIQRMAEQYGVAAGDIARVMEQNPGMSAEQAAQYIKGNLLFGATGLNIANMPPVPPGGGDGGALTGADDASSDDGPAPLDASDLGFRVEVDSTTDTSVVYVEFTGPHSDVQRQLYEDGPYELTDSYDAQSGQYSVQVRSRETGEVLGEVNNARLANAGDRFAEVVQFNADKLFGDNASARNAYINAWRGALDVVLHPNKDRGHGRPPGNPTAESTTRLFEALQGERVQIDRTGSGVEIILPDGALPEAAEIPGIHFEAPGNAPTIP